MRDKLDKGFRLDEQIGLNVHMRCLIEPTRPTAPPNHVEPSRDANDQPTVDISGINASQLESSRRSTYGGLPIALTAIARPVKTKRIRSL